MHIGAFKVLIKATRKGETMNITVKNAEYATDYEAFGSLMAELRRQIQFGTHAISTSTENGYHNNAAGRYDLYKNPKNDNITITFWR